jgi:inositol 1,4,5-triphosphate receptor type 3
VLFYEEHELEPEFMTTLMKFLIGILQGGNLIVQNTIYEFFLSNSACEKFFQRVADIMNKQIMCVNTTHKLTGKEVKLIQKTIRILQLLCEGHNNDL